MIDIINKYLPSLSSNDLEKGFFFDESSNAYVCLFCEARFQEGVIYPVEDALVTSAVAIERHIRTEHEDPFSLLLDLGKEYTGVSEAQEAVLREIWAGYPDREIAQRLGGKSPSTVRNHRFQLRKRRNEAKIFLAIMNLLERKDRYGEEFVDFHADLTVRDDRVIVTREEADRMLRKYFREKGKLSLIAFPRKQKSKLVILDRIAHLFERHRRYTEKQVNRIIAEVFPDYVTIRRYLIDYGFFDRNRDGSEYWLR